jgi:hypothetical protein
LATEIGGGSLSAGTANAGKAESAALSACARLWGIAISMALTARPRPKSILFCKEEVFTMRDLTQYSLRWMVDLTMRQAPRACRWRIAEISYRSQNVGCIVLKGTPINDRVKRCNGIDTHGALSPRRSDARGLRPPLRVTLLKLLHELACKSSESN